MYMICMSGVSPAACMLSPAIPSSMISHLAVVRLSCNHSPPCSTRSIISVTPPFNSSAIVTRGLAARWTVSIAAWKQSKKNVMVISIPMRYYPSLSVMRKEASWWGIGLAIAAAIAMPLLWRSKLRIARRIESVALKADAMCSVTCAYMAITLLAGLLLNKFFGWWWADPLAALVLVYFIFKEGREGLQEARTGETCDCGGDDLS